MTSTPDKPVTPFANRRQALALMSTPCITPASSLANWTSVGGALLLGAATPSVCSAQVAQAAAQRGVRTDRITVLYRRESADAPLRSDPAVQMAIRQLERALVESGLSVMQAGAELYALMDQGQRMVVTFAADAGFSLVFTALSQMRPVPQQGAAIAEVRLEARVVVGRQILAVESGRGQMLTSLEGGAAAFGERRAVELAATRAAEDLAGKTIVQLKALTADRVAALLGNDLPGKTEGQAVASAADQGFASALPPTQTSPPGAGAAAQTAAAPIPPSGSAVPATPSVNSPPPQPVPASPPSTAVTSVAQAAQEPSSSNSLPAPAKRWALIVAISDYSGLRQAGVKGVTDLKGPTKDAGNLYNALSRLGYRDDRMAVLLDDKATGRAMRDVLKQFAAKVGPDDVVVLFISAHGADCT